MNYKERLARPKPGCDYHKEFIEQYVEYPPFAVDEETGEVLNKSSQPILVRVADKNLYEETQSYKEEVDIYNILKQYAETGDESLINRRVTSFMDIADIPDNINELHGYFEAKAKLLNEFSTEDQNIILSGENVDALIDRKVKELLVAKGINVEEKGEDDAK